MTQTMSSYRKGAQTKPTTAAGLRAQASTNGQSIYGNRSRISGLLSLNQNNLPFNAGLLGVKSPNLYSGASFLNKGTKSSDLYRSNSYAKSANNPNYQNLFTTYGGTSTGYGGVTLSSPTAHNLPAHTAHNLPSHTVHNLSSHTVHNLPSHTAHHLPSHTSHNLSSKLSSTHSLPSHSPLNLSPSPSYNYLNLNTRPHVQKTESFSRSRAKPSLSVGSRSSSLQSLTSSEGYAVSSFLDFRILNLY